MAVALAQSLAAGDPEAFAVLYDRLADRLLGVASTMTGCASDAEDIVQELFVELARFRGRLAAVIDIEAYVFTMLRNAARRRGRRAAVGRRALVAIAENRRASGAVAVSMAELPDDELAQAVARLPDVQREVVALKIEGGLTFAEIGAVTGTSPNTAASRYRYAIDKLRATLTDSEDEP